MQRMRITRPATKLVERLEIWMMEDYDDAKATQGIMTNSLSEASHVGEIIQLIGMVYSLLAHQVFGCYGFWVWDVVNCEVDQGMLYSADEVY